MKLALTAARLSSKDHGKELTYTVFVRKMVRPLDTTEDSAREHSLIQTLMRVTVIN